MSDPRVIFGLFTIGVLLIVAVITFKNIKTRPVSFGILWFLIALAPTSSVVPFYQVANDHRVFFPNIGLALSASWFIGLTLIKYENRIQNNLILKYGLLSLFTCAILAHAYGTYQRNKVWGSAESLWYDVTIKNPKNGRGLMNYGVTQMRKGKSERALYYFEKALEYNPYYSYLHVNLGLVKNAMGEPAKEVEMYFNNALNYG